MKKIFYSAAFVALLSLSISCEKDFRDVGSSVVDNSQFSTGKDTIEIEITPLDVESVRADNVGIGALGEYLLGVYNKPQAKTIEASIVSQIGYLSALRNEQISTLDSIDSIYTLDHVVLTIPYTSTKLEDLADGRPVFDLDSLLGDNNTAVNLSVLRNNTFLNTLNPNDPSEFNSFQSNQEYDDIENLTDNSVYEFKPQGTDTIVEFTRTLSTGVVFNDTIKQENSVPFLAIPLDKNRMKELFWDKFNDPEFEDSEEFQNYFRGVIIKAEGTNGSMVPLSLTNARLEFYYNITRMEEVEGQTERVYKDSIPTKYTFPLSGVRNSHYKMTNASTTVPNNTFMIQGTAGTMAEIKILDEDKLAELRGKDWLINDALLTFYIDENQDTEDVPLRLFAYKKGNPGSHIKDAYSESSFFGGALQYDADDNPEKYEIRIGDYISDLLSGEINTNPNLVLKVYNVDTDVPFSNNALDTIVKTYNWNPRSVRLLNHLQENGSKRAKLIISYSE